jgi:hypothetical protein
MTPEEYYKEVVKLDMDKFDKKAPKFDYYDLIDFADSYHKKQLNLTDVVVPKGTLCECKGSGGIRMDGTCGRCTKPLEIHKD